MIGNLLVGIALRFTGVRQGVADMEALDIATKRAALSLAIAKKEIGGFDVSPRATRGHPVRAEVLSATAS